MSDRRPRISKAAKDIVWAREKGVCQGCGKQIGERLFSVINHTPPLWVRKRDETKPRSDPAGYHPHANDPAYMTLLHNPQTTPCKAHDLQTFGDGLYRGDVQEFARFTRRKKKEAAEAAFRAQILAPADPFRNGVSDIAVGKPRVPRKRVWPKRKMQSRSTFRKEGSPNGD